MLVKCGLKYINLKYQNDKYLNMLMDTNFEEGYYCFNASIIIIESLMLDINQNSNQLYCKKKIWLVIKT